MKNKRNYYRVLHVQPDAPVELIRMSYRTMMQKMRMHPDLGGDEWDAAVINEAYAVLSNEKKRSLYDQLLFTERAKADIAVQDERQRKKEEEEEDDEDQEDLASNDSTDSYDQYNEYDKEKVKDEIEPDDDAETNLNTQHYDISSTCPFCRKPYNGIPAFDTKCMRCQSPLYVVIPQRFEKMDQRGVERIASNCYIHFYDQWPGSPHQGKLINLSLNGLQFHSTSILAVGVRVRIESAKFAGIAEICNHQVRANNIYSYGCKFITLRFTQESGSFVRTSV